MRDEDWLFEAYALRKREEREWKMQVEIAKGYKNMMVNLLGLNIVERVGQPDAFVPLSMICGTPELLQHILEEREVEEGAKNALEDEAFDAWSERMAAGEFEDDLLPADAEEPIQVSRTPRVSFDDE